MKDTFNTKTSLTDLHHAYFVIGDPDEALQHLLFFFENELKLNIRSNPDFLHTKFETLTIDDARDIIKNQESKDFSKGHKIFIIQTNFITQETQNALLKVFEEPTVGTHFFILSPQDMLLPTLRSRMQVVNANNVVKPSESFLDLSLAERLIRVKGIVESISDEESSKQDAIAFLNQIEGEIYKKGPEKARKELTVCEMARASLYDRGAPIKIILENLALSI